jgi:hypothetical protein
MLIKNCKILLIFLIIIFPSTSFSQMEISGAYYTKNYPAFNGFGGSFSHNLPYQFPDFGVKVRLDGSYFSTENSSSASYKNIDLNISLITSFFYRYFSPYIGLGFGLGNFAAEAEQNAARLDSDSYSENNFLLSGLAGIRFNFIGFVIPFVEFQSFRYFSKFEHPSIDAKIKPVQLRGVFGINIPLHYLE